MNNAWVQIILCLAPLVVVPLALGNGLFFKVGYKLRLFGWLAALLLSVGQFIEPSRTAGILAIPWLIFTLMLLRVIYVERVLQMDKLSLSRVCIATSWCFLCIGAMWAIADRMGWQPLGFDPVIVLLTAVHFHYAGFALVWITAMALIRTKATWAKRIMSAVILGVPLTALGIIASHWNWSPLIEVLAVSIMVTGGMAVGISHLKIAVTIRGSVYTRVFLGISGIALVIGMGLAFLYGMHNYWSLPWLTIPWMYSVHGTLNALGFALPAMLGWRLFSKTQSVT